MVEGPRRSLCSDNRAPDGKKLEGENRLRMRFSPSKVGPKISLCSDNRLSENSQRAILLFSLSLCSDNRLSEKSQIQNEC